jgi:hypothetical protein
VTFARVLCVLHGLLFFSSLFRATLDHDDLQISRTL